MTFTKDNVIYIEEFINGNHMISSIIGIKLFIGKTIEDLKYNVVNDKFNYVSSIDLDKLIFKTNENDIWGRFIYIPNCVKNPNPYNLSDPQVRDYLLGSTIIVDCGGIISDWRIDTITGFRKVYKKRGLFSPREREWVATTSSCGKLDAYDLAYSCRNYETKQFVSGFYLSEK